VAVEAPRPRPAAVSIDPPWRRGVHAVQRRSRELGRAAGQRWRSSLQTRVVLTTLVVSSLVVALFISLLLESVGRGLVDAKTRTALGEARSGVVTVESDPRLLTEELSVPEQVSRLEDVFEDLAGRAAGSDYRVLLVGSTGGAFSSGDVGDDDVPDGLVDRLDDREVPAYVFAPVPEGASESSLVVGSPVRLPQDLGEYRLFHVFPLTAEQETLGLVRRTATVSGVLLVGLLALITGLVARQVVAPVRAAARTAARLASGRLDERLTVHGEDEIARLGSSFNSMADALQSQIRLLEDLSRVQRRFVSDVSHELRTPLTTVRMAADVLFDAREDFPRGVALGRAAAGRARPLRGAARRPAGDQPLRRGRRRPRRQRHRPVPGRAPRARRRRAAGRPARQPLRPPPAGPAGRRRRRAGARRAGAAQPRRQRRRARRGPARSRWRSRRTTTRWS
jgi:two-component system sensor histidine kinase MtrB